MFLISAALGIRVLAGGRSQLKQIIRRFTFSLLTNPPPLQQSFRVYAVIRSCCAAILRRYWPVRSDLADGSCRMQKLWGRPPGLRGSPWTRSSQRDQSHLDGKAGQGAVRGPGVRPTIFADRPVMGKTSGIGLIACHKRYGENELSRS